MRNDILLIDGAHVEGGAQDPARPGLAAQHLTTVRAAAARFALPHSVAMFLGSQDLTFVPQRPVCLGRYAFDVAAAHEGGSAGGTSLVLQTVMLPLAVCTGAGHVRVQCGTHLPQSLPFDYVRDVWLQVLRQLGIRATVALDAWGWFPVGRGAIRAEIARAPPSAGKL